METVETGLQTLICQRGVCDAASPRAALCRRISCAAIAFPALPSHFLRFSSRLAADAEWQPAFCTSPATHFSDIVSHSLSSHTHTLSLILTLSLNSF